MDNILAFLKPVVDFLVIKFPVLGAIGANALAAMIAIGLLIEIVEAIALVTKSTKDDEAVGKIKKIRDKVLPVLEIFPHVNVPVVAAIVVVTKVLGKAKAVVLAILGAIKKPE